jgi:hypothetical protein
LRAAWPFDGSRWSFVQKCVRDAVPDGRYDVCRTGPALPTFGREPDDADTEEEVGLTDAGEGG